LKNLGFAVKDDQSNLKIQVPIWRGPADINIPEDIYEEIARIW
jgi:phenylalanyl-tRNA synthetase beta subunit